MSLEDKAQEHEYAEWAQRNLNRPSIPVYEPDHPMYGPEFCDDCEAELHPVRRAMGRRLCVHCTELNGG